MDWMAPIGQLVGTVALPTTTAAAKNGPLLAMHPIDYAVLVVYLLFVVGIGVLTGRKQKTSEDFFLSGRSIPSWITGLAFISANLGALEVMGMATSGYEYGMITANYYWIGAIPAMVFMGVAMMRFFYGSKVRSVPEFLNKRYNEGTRFVNAVTFAIFTPAISGISMYALALVLQDFLGLNFNVSVLISALVVLVYTFLGGLTASIYNEVLQFFLIVFGVAPLTIIALIANHGWAHFKHWLATHQLYAVYPKAAVAATAAKLHATANATANSAHAVMQGATAAHAKAAAVATAGVKLSGSQWLHTWTHMGSINNPLQTTWPGVVLGLGFVLSFSYWCTNFLVVQRALAAKDMTAAQDTPLLAAFPKMIFPFIVILPGVLAIPLIPHLLPSGPGVAPTKTFNNVMPLMMARYYPAGLLGLGLTALMASFMSGMAGNVTAFNTVVTYDLYAAYIRPNATDKHYLNFGRLMTVVGIIISVGFAYAVAGSRSIMGYTQNIFGVVNAPLIAVFLLGMFTGFTTPMGGFAGIVIGTLTSLTLFVLRFPGWPMAHTFNNGTSGAFWCAVWSFLAGATATIVVSLFTKNKPREQLVGLVYQLTPKPEAHDVPLWRRPLVIGIVALICALILNLFFW